VSDADPTPAAGSVTTSLLVPLLDTAAEAIVGTPAGELPLSLRPLAAFDRRGLVRGPAKETLRRALESEQAFRREVVAHFRERPEVQAALALVDDIGPVRAVERAVDRDDLPLLTSALWASDRADREFALGVAVARDESRRRQMGQDQELLSQERRVAEIDEARRRAESALTDAEREVARLSEQLRDDRGARRAELEAALRAHDDAERRVKRAETSLEDARGQVRDAEGRASREAKRSRELEDDLRRIRRERDDARERLESRDGDARGRGSLDLSDLRLLADAADGARRLGQSLDALLARVDPTRARAVGRGRTPDADRPSAPVRRPPPVPGGLVADSPEGLRAMLRVPDVVLVVDGYNVSKGAWAEAPLADQRHRLCTALGEVHRRTGCDVVVVFDGDGSEVIPPLRRLGLQVLFSAPGEQADDVVIRTVADLPRHVPSVVASSDAWVRDQARATGAAVVSSDTLRSILAV
jgi:predicted RNA-binding protein with PIN domain/exonuclease VII small subunit